MAIMWIDALGARLGNLKDVFVASICNYGHNIINVAVVGGDKYEIGEIIYKTVPKSIRLTGEDFVDINNVYRVYFTHMSLDDYLEVTKPGDKKRKTYNPKNVRVTLEGVEINFFNSDRDEFKIDSNYIVKYKNEDEILDEYENYIIANKINDYMETGKLE